MASIYKITNTINGKVYVGKCTDVERRYTQHFNNLEKNSHYNKGLQEDFNNFGRDTFRFDILEDFEDLPNPFDLEIAEYSWIIKLQSDNEMYNDLSYVRDYSLASPIKDNEVFTIIDKLNNIISDRASNNKFPITVECKDIDITGDNQSTITRYILKKYIDKLLPQFTFTYRNNLINVNPKKEQPEKSLRELTVRLTTAEKSLIDLMRNDLSIQNLTDIYIALTVEYRQMIKLKEKSDGKGIDPASELTARAEMLYEFQTLVKQVWKER